MAPKKRIPQIAGQPALIFSRPSDVGQSKKSESTSAVATTATATDLKCIMYLTFRMYAYIIYTRNIQCEKLLNFTIIE